MHLGIFCFHPVEPHFYKNVARYFEKKHKVTFLLFAKEKITQEILRKFGFQYTVINKHYNGNKYLAIIPNLLKIIRKLREKNIDLILSATSPYAALSAKILRLPAIGFSDTEIAKFNNIISFPFYNSVLTPDCFYKKVPSKKHIPFLGYKELAYLHPNWFNPENHILDKLKINRDEKIILMRFSELKAMHDIGLNSAINSTRSLIIDYIEQLEKHGKIFISMSERELGEEFEKYRLRIEPTEYHNFLAHCSLYIGEGTTTASEAGVLGVPWINILPTRRGYLIDQEENFGLGYHTNDVDSAFSTALDWIKDDSLKEKWKVKQRRLLEDKIDVSSFLIWFIENYPGSHRIMKENPDYQLNFK
jgi:hypothetical protein